MFLILDLEAAKICNNFTNQKVNMSATVTLQCDAVGTPNPTVVWTKNNQTIEEESGGKVASLDCTHFKSGKSY